MTKKTAALLIAILATVLVSSPNLSAQAPTQSGAPATSKSPAKSAPQPKAQSNATSKTSPKKPRPVPSAVVEDPGATFGDPTPASMQELAIPSVDGAMMNGIMYLAAGQHMHPTVILLHGFPGNEQNLDLAQSIRRVGWNVLYFHYRGAWGSAGDFSFSNAMQDTLAAIKFLRVPNNYVGYRVDTSRIVLVGHSMGGFMAAYAASQDPKIRGVVLISPWNIVADAATWGNERKHAEVLAEYRGYERALHGTTAEKLMAEAMAPLQPSPGLVDYSNLFLAWDFTKGLTQIRDSKRPILLTYGSNETDLDIGYNPSKKALKGNTKNPSKNFTAVTLPTDHAYSDHRIALQSVVVNWLEQVAKK
jgi:pimeloyl-ACP methyl ester carboxylesterase